MKSKVFLIAVIVILVFLNLGTLPFMWVNRPHRPDRGGQADPSEYMTEKLGLDNGQRYLLKIQRIRFHMEMKRLQWRDHQIHKRFFDLVLLTPADSIRALRLADSIALLRMEMEMLTFSHFSEVRRMLNEAQRKKFDTVFYDALRVALPPPPPSSPPPPPPPRK